MIYDFYKKHIKKFIPRQIFFIWNRIADQFQIEKIQRTIFHPIESVKNFYKKTFVEKEKLFRKITASTIAKFRNNRKTITSFVPFDFTPNNFGGSIRILSVYKALSKHFNINLIGITGQWDYIKRIKINKNLYIYIIPSTKEYWDLVKKEEALVDGHLHDILITKNYELIPNLVSLCQKLVKTTDYFVSSHPYFFNMLTKYAWNKKIIYEAHNVDYDLKKTYFNSNNLYAKKYLETVKDIEAIASQKSDIIMAVSEGDKKRLSELYKVEIDKIFVVPNGIVISETKYFPMNKRLKLINDNRKKAVFVGATHFPNIEAVDFIINELAPKFEDIDFIVIGNIKDVFKNKKIPKNVAFTGMISKKEKEIFYKKSHMAINPMFSGSGSNLKIPEYAAYGLPIISTNFGMRGFEKMNSHVFLAEKNFLIKEINNFLKTDYKTLNLMVFNARKICENHYSSNSVVNDIVKALK